MEELATIAIDGVKSEISSTNSRDTNRKALYRKLRSRKYKCIAYAFASFASTLLILWLAFLTKFTRHLLDQLQVNSTGLNTFTHSAVTNQE